MTDRAVRPAPPGRVRRRSTRRRRVGPPTARGGRRAPRTRGATAPAAPGSGAPGPGRRTSAPVAVISAWPPATASSGSAPPPGRPRARRRRPPSAPPAVQPGLVDRLVRAGARSSGGRSAVSTSSGIPAESASSTAACRCAAAVPDVVSTGDRPPGRLGQAEGEERRRPLVDAHVQPQPAVALGGGQRHGDRRRPRARREHGVGDAAAHQFVDQDPAERGGRVHAATHRGQPRAATGRPVDGSRRHLGQPVGLGRRTGSAAVDRQQRGARHVAGEQRHGGQPARERQLGQRGRQRDPGGDARPSAPAPSDTTHGRPCASATRSAARTPPSGCTLRTTTSAGLAQVDPRADRRRAGPTSSAAIRTSIRRRSAASSARVGARLLGVLEADAGPARAMRATAVSTSQAPLASTRIAPSGPSASRTASTRARSSAGVCPGSATLTFAVRHPDAVTIACARSGPTAGTVDVDRHRVAHRVRPAGRAASSRGGPPAAALGDVVVPERRELAPAGRARGPARRRARRCRGSGCAGECR